MKKDKIYLNHILETISNIEKFGEAQLKKLF